MTPHLESIFDLARFWKRKKADSLPHASAPSVVLKEAFVFYDANLNIATREEAVYELSFFDTFGLQWRFMKGTRTDAAPFSIWAYTLDWDVEQWSNYPSNVITDLIPLLLSDPQSSCYTAFHWLHQEGANRIRPFLSTHRGSLDNCERIFIWLAWEFIPSDRSASQSSWTIAVRQDDAQEVNLSLWSHVKRDCTLLVDDEPLLMSDEQLKLLRIVHCYFLPFYLENARRYHPAISRFWKNDAIQWQIDVPSPTQHERLEARLQLREWLRNKVSPNELALLLGDS